MPLEDRYQDRKVRGEMAGIKFRITEGDELAEYDGPLRAYLDHCEAAKGDRQLLFLADIRP